MRFPSSSSSPWFEISVNFSSCVFIGASLENKCPKFEGLICCQALAAYGVASSLYYLPREEDFKCQHKSNFNFLSKRTEKYV